MPSAFDIIRFGLRTPSEPGFIVEASPGRNATAIAAALADLLPIPAPFVEIAGRYVHPDGWPALLEPLLSGQPVLVASRVDEEFVGRLAQRWVRWCENSRFASLQVAHNLTLEPSMHRDQLGTVIAVVTDLDHWGEFDLPTRVHMSEAEAHELEASPQGTCDAVIGVAAPIITMRDLCLLHARDPAVPLSQLPRDVPSWLSESVTWTSLEDLVASGHSNRHWLDHLWTKERIDDEKWAYGHAAFDFLREFASRAPRGLQTAVYDTIWDAVWTHRGLDAQRDYIFRGQFDGRWSLSPSLFRSESTGPATIETVINRIDLTHRFLRELRRRAPDLLGTVPTEEELLAIAQHYGFATSLLDFTHSLAIAAFFATLHQPTLQDETIGIIYYSTPSRDELSAGRDLKERLTLADFSLLDAARLNFGDVHAIEPTMSNADNRIARQQGVFVSGYQVRDLQRIAIDRIYFRQRPGEKFEDVSRGVTADDLLPPDSPIQALADEVRASTDDTAHVLNPTLASTRLPDAPIVGSDGALLAAQIMASGKFFDAVRSTCEPTRIRELASIFDQYFGAARARADAGEALSAHSSEPATVPLALACDALAELTATDPRGLWASVFSMLDPGPAEDAGAVTTPPIDARTPNERLAVACGLFLAGWEQLQFVRGAAARRLIWESTSLLSN